MKRSGRSRITHSRSGCPTLSLIGNRGYRRYVKMEGAKLSIDGDDIKAEKKYSGKYVLRTNARLTPLATCH